MKLVVASAPDLASVTQRDALLRLAEWREAGEFAGSPTYRSGDFALVTIPDLHLHHDHVDREAQARFGARPELVVFLSKHRSESGTPSLTVHPIGNFGAADLGGRPGTLVPTDARFMTETLRRIRAVSAGMGYAVTSEATHHGPFLDTPAFFLEAGSTETEWRDPAAAEILVRAVLSVKATTAPVAIGIGGGHYVPRLTDVALGRLVAFGHLVADYAVPFLTDPVIDQVVARTPGASLVYFHRKAIENGRLRDLEARFATRGLRAVRERDLAPLGPQQSY